MAWAAVSATIVSAGAFSPTARSPAAQFRRLCVQARSSSSQMRRR
ncbi:hypothetical protein ACIHFD_35515 [Nonomuraea sp. NPDC051941]